MTTHLRRFLPVFALAAIACLGMLAYAGDPQTDGPRSSLAVTSPAALQSLLSQSRTPVILDFHATWCGPCRRLGPELESLAKNHPGAITVITVDVDEAPELAQEYSVSSIPHLVLIEGGKKVKERLGFASRTELARWAGIDGQ